MKRPRESCIHSNCGENDIPLPPIESMAEMAAGEGLPTPVTPSAREQQSRQHRNQRHCSFLPKNLLLGLCLVAVLALSGIVPTAHASSTARNMSFANSASADGYDFLRHRRIEEKDSAVAEPFATSNVEECTVPVTKCMECSFSEQKSFDVCKETGKWQKFKCIMPGSTGSEDEDSDARFEMMSCKHTDFDNGIAMLQFQVFCLLIGGLSIVSVKKQKKLSLSMFDRRKQQGANAKATSNVINNKRSDDHTADEEEHIEFTPMTNQQRERVPLVARMEVI